MTCAIVGGGNGLCRSCPARGCEIIVQIPDRAERDFECVWQLGESVDDVKSVACPSSTQDGQCRVSDLGLVLRQWVYDPADNCFVSMIRTDCAKRGSKSPSSLFVSEMDGTVLS